MMQQKYNPMDDYTIIVEDPDAILEYKQFFEEQQEKQLRKKREYLKIKKIHEKIGNIGTKPGGKALAMAWTYWTNPEKRLKNPHYKIIDRYTKRHYVKLKIYSKKYW